MPALSDLSAGIPSCIPRLRTADRAAPRLGRRVSAPRAATIAGEDAEGREVWLLASAPIPIGSGRPRGPTATFMRPSLPARASRSRSPRTRCAAPRARRVRPSEPILARLRECCSTSCRGSRPTAPSTCCGPAGSCARCPATRASSAARRDGARRRRRRWPRAGDARHDPGGELVEAPGSRACLSSARSRTSGPFYKLYPEGTIEHFDGKRVPSPFFVGDNPSISTATFRGRGRRRTSRSAPARFLRASPSRAGSSVRDRASRDLRVDQLPRSAAC